MCHLQRRERGALVERLTASPVMNASRVRTFLKPAWVFPCFSLRNVTRRSRELRPRRVKVETMQCVDVNFAQNRTLRAPHVTFTLLTL